jgi:hypothetical protein
LRFLTLCCVFLIVFPLNAYAYGQFTFALWDDLDPNEGWTPYAGQFTSSGPLDVAYYQETTGTIRVGVGDGTQFVTALTPWAMVSPPQGWLLAAGDFTGDTLDDLVGFQPSTGSVWLLENTGSGFDAEPWGSMTSSSIRALLVGDYDADGENDVLLYDDATGQLWVGIADGSSFNFSVWQTLSPAEGWNLAAGEFSGTPGDDIAGYHACNPCSSASVWIGNSTGTHFDFNETSFVVGSPAAANWQLLAGDFEGSSLSDLVLYQDSDIPGGGSVWVARNTGSGFDITPTHWTPELLTPARGWRISGGDLDADGRLDLIGYHPSNGAVYALIQKDHRALGYAWPLSGAPGDGIDFMISGAVSPTVRFYRHLSMGVDVSSQLMGSRTFAPTVQPIQDQPDRNGAGWSPSLRLTIPENWPSGIYSAELTATYGPDFNITFVVRPAPEEAPTVAVLANVNTWNAYNAWAGRNKYSGNERQSFLRPNPSAGPIGESFGNHHLTRAELWVLGWLDSVGYRPHVYTDIDFHNGLADSAYDHIVLSTHPEYFTTEMYDRLASHLEAGSSLLYIGGNGLYERAAYAEDQQQVVYLNGVPGGDRAMELFRRLTPPRPERSLLGVATEACIAKNAAVTGDAFPRSFFALEPSHPLFAGTGILEGETFGNLSLNNGGGFYAPGGGSAWEFDTSLGLGARNGGCGPDAPSVVDYGLPAGLSLLASADPDPTPGERSKGGDIVHYTHPEGGSVLSIGSITAGGSLVVDPVLQRMVYNHLGPPTPSGSCLPPWPWPWPAPEDYDLLLCPTSVRTLSEAALAFLLLILLSVTAFSRMAVARDSA